MLQTAYVKSTKRPGNDFSHFAAGLGIAYTCKFATCMYKAFSSYKWLLLLPALAAWATLVPGCANIIPPTGGPKDSLPPVLIKATPVNMATQFKGANIELEFDEYIQLDNLQQELIVNPPFDRTPDITGRLRHVYIKVRDTLQPNTTYSFQFGNAIKDVNESNPLRNFKYVFSTGSYIDSLQLSGTVINAETGLPDSTLSILLHSDPDDSAVAKIKPRFITKPNGKGEFRFEQMPPGRFYIFALKDEGMRRYSSNRTMFAFNDSMVATGTNPAPVELRAFAAEKEPPKTSTAGSNNQEGNNAPNRQKVDKNVLINTSANENMPQDLLSSFEFKFTKKIARIDSSKLMLADTNAVAKTNYKLTLDTAQNRVVLQYPWKENEFFMLRIAKGFAIDTAGNINTKTDTVLFKTKSEREYGALKINLTGINLALHPVLQWVEAEQVVQTTVLTSNKVNIPLFKPGEYVLRILYDANQNGKWDTGDYWKKIQPEVVLAIEQKFSIKAGWENEFDIEL